LLDHNWRKRRHAQRTVKKNAILAELVFFAIAPPLLCGLSSAAIIIIDTPQPAEPHIMGLRRPVLSRKKVGYSDPMGNMRLMIPPRRRERLRVRPTLFCRTNVT